MSDTDTDTRGVLILTRGGGAVPAPALFALRKYGKHGN